MFIVKIFKKLLFITPIIVMIFGFDYYVDPANIFKGADFYRDIVTILLKGKNVAGISNLDDRLLQKELIGRLTHKKDIVVLGSSQIMQINSVMFPGYSFINNGVNRASVEDDMAIYWMYRKKGLFPSKILIGLNPYLLNKYNELNRYKSLLIEYNEIATYLNVRNNNQNNADVVSDKYYELLSLGYFQTSFWYWVNQEKPFYLTVKAEEIQGVRHADGSLSYCYSWRNRSPAKVYSDALVAVSQDPSNVYSNFGKFDSLDPDLIYKFDKLICLMQRDNVEVTFILTPYHPKVYQQLVENINYRIIKDAEKFFIEYAKNHNIRMIGSYNPSHFHFTNSDFLDDQHLRQEALYKIYYLYK